jgi:RNA polymerase sigma factor (sigma-70 family)
MDLEAPDDATLLRGHARGDPQAFARLYDRYDRACFGFIRRQLGGAHAAVAEDLHQETWLAISRHAATFDPGTSSFRTWLFTIARRKVWDHFRRQKVAVLTSAQEDSAMSVPDPGQTPLEQVQSRELAHEIVAAVEALPLEQRGVFVLFADAGLSLEEIAEVTGVTLETVRSRLRYARQKLRQSLATRRSAHV